MIGLNPIDGGYGIRLTTMQAPHNREEIVVPVIEVKLYDRRITDPDASAKIIKEMTDALCRACDDEGVRDHTTVIVTGVAPEQWGIAGNPGS